MASLFATLVILCWLFVYSDYGFNFTDEGFHLAWMANPFIYDWSVTQFGYIYHPLYMASGGDVADLRRINIGITFSISCALVFLLMRQLACSADRSELSTAVVAAGFSSVSLVLFDSWLVTPNYNSLALQALLVSAVGMVLARENYSRKSLVGWGLIGLGGWLAFMAKPTTALALAVCVLFYLVASRKFSLGLLAVSLFSALAPLIGAAFLIDGSPMQFISRLEVGLQLASLLGAGHGLWEMVRLDSFTLTIKEIVVSVAILSSSFFAVWFSLYGSKYKIIYVYGVSLVYLFLVVSVASGWLVVTVGFGFFQGLLVWSVALSAVAIGVVFSRREKIDLLPAFSWSAVTIFLAMPHVYAFGTNNNYWQHGSSAAIFWLLAGVVFLGPIARIKRTWSFALPLVLAVQAVSAALLQTGVEHPHRQTQFLRLNDAIVKVGAADEGLILSDEFAAYIERARHSVRLAGLQVGTPIVDLTGQSPGLLFALQAENIGQAWMIGGHPGSLKLAVAALGRTPCEKIASAWLLVETDGRRIIPVADVLSGFGANLSEHYAEASSWMTAPDAGASRNLPPRLQILYKPSKQGEILASCRATRRGALE